MKLLSAMPPTKARSIASGPIVVFGKNTNIGIGVGILLQCAGKVLVKQEGVLILPGFLALLVGTAGIIWGCMN
jgi:hypothetical protein